MNFKGISYYLSLFCFPISILAFINILYSSYFDYFLSVSSYIITLIISLVIGSVFLIIGKKAEKRINFIEQLILIILVYLLISLLIALPFYLSNYQVTFLNSLFESISGVTGTGFSVFKNIKYLDPTLILWRSSSQWIGGLYFLFFLIIVFSNKQFKYKINDLTYTADIRIKLENNINFAITRGSLNRKKSIPVRVISTRVSKINILKNIKVRKSLKTLSRFKSYLLLIINNQNKTLKDSNINTLRYYGIGAQIIKDLNVKNMILLSRSRKKIIGLDGFDLKIKKQIIIK